MKFFRSIAAIVVATMSSSVMAGLIASDGNEWEVRGAQGNFASHELAATTDSGWAWASYDEWSGSGLGGGYGVGELNSFLGSASMEEGSFVAFFSDLPIQDQFGSTAFSGVLGGDSGTVFGVPLTGVPLSLFSQQASVLAGGFGESNVVFRVSYRSPATVPEPGTLALLAVGLAGLGFSRKASSV